VSLTLSPDELRELTGRKRAGAQRRALKAMGIAFVQTPEGQPRVLRALVERMMGGIPSPTKREPELRI